MLLSSFKHKQQRLESDCLVACVEMVLEYLHMPITHTQIAKRLRAESFGTPFGNTRFLTALGLTVTIEYEGTVEIFEPYWAMGLPVIVNVKTIGWTHWQNEETYHAVVVVGIDYDNQLIFIHDPFFSHAPIELTFTTFLVGWEEQRRQYAVIGLAELYE